MSAVRHVLLVDDDDGIREIGAMSLELAGWSVTAAASGGECLALLARMQPDAVVLDVMMPGLDGPGTLAALRAAGLDPEPPVVFLTAKAQAHEREHLLTLGAAGVLAKPFNPLLLAADIARLLGWEAPP